MILQREKPTEHWYTADGMPSHDSDLRDARKKGLYPSVTSVLKIQSNPGLEAWKIREAIISSLTLPRIYGESDQDFAARVLTDSKGHSKDSADIGTAHHDFAEDWYKGNKPDMINGYEGNCILLASWIDKHLGEGFAEESFCNNDYGYAGKIDWFGKLKDGRLAYIDYKTQGVKPGARPVFYDSWCQQLAAYSGGQTDVAQISVLIGVHPENQFIKVSTWTQDEVEKGWKIFQHLLAVWMLDRNYDPRKFYVES